jgi:hypothetical protein
VPPPTMMMFDILVLYCENLCGMDWIVCCLLFAMSTVIIKKDKA